MSKVIVTGGNRNRYPVSSHQKLRGALLDDADPGQRQTETTLEFRGVDRGRRDEQLVILATRDRLVEQCTLSDRNGVRIQNNSNAAGIRNMSGIRGQTVGNVDPRRCVVRGQPKRFVYARPRLHESCPARVGWLEPVLP